jgi:hypothetical protein
LNCTNQDACDGNGTCVGVSVCDDSLPCTDDFADELNLCACTHSTSFPGTVCDDGNPCTTGTVCDGAGGTAASCGGGGSAPNGTACDDASACTTGDACNSGVCVGGGAPNCDDGNVCTDDSCNPSTGLCDHVNNAAGCSDGNACTVGDVCSGGGCAAGAPTVCNDNNACTDDTCNPANGACAFANNTASCSDGNACTTGDTCSGGSCAAGTPTVCNDNNVCTADDCNPATGCVFGDANLDATGFSAGRVDGRDLIVLADAWNACPADPRYNAAANLDHGTVAPDSCIDLSDFHLFMDSFSQSCP